MLNRYTFQILTNRYSLATLFLILLLVSPSPRLSAQPYAETKITASDGESFGRSVSLFENRALIGSLGSAYVFELQNGAWTEVAKLTASDDSDNSFGKRVSLFNDRALIGSSSSAYVFELQNGTWTEVAKLTASDGVSFSSMSLYGDWALFGAHLDDVIGFDSGAAYLFERQGTHWKEVTKFMASNTDEWDRFGKSVSLFDNRALIGAEHADGTITLSGSAYIFELQNGVWTEIDELIAPEYDQFDFVGNAVSLSGDRALVGAHHTAIWGEDFYDFWVGSAYIFELQNGVWQKAVRLIASDWQEYEVFGTSVSLSGDRAIITSRSSVYVFELKDGEWTEVSKILPGGPRSLFANHALIGNPSDDDQGNDAGAAYIFDLDPPVAYRIDVLSTQLDDIYGEGSLEKRQQSQLSGLLYQALNSYNSGYVNNAIKSMQQFVDFATQLLALNHLPDEDAQSLIDQGQAIIDKIEEENGGAGKTESQLTETSLQDLPQTFVLHQNHPNPFNPSTVIHFALPEQSEVRLTVYDMLGREVERLVDGVREAGNHEVTFDAGGLPSGTYMYRFETPQTSFVRRMVLLR